MHVQPGAVSVSVDRAGGSNPYPCDRQERSRLPRRVPHSCRPGSTPGDAGGPFSIKSAAACDYSWLRKHTPRLAGIESDMYRRELHVDRFAGGPKLRPWTAGEWCASERFYEVAEWSGPQPSRRTATYEKSSARRVPHRAVVAEATQWRAAPLRAVAEQVPPIQTTVTNALPPLSDPSQPRCRSPCYKQLVRLTAQDTVSAWQGEAGVDRTSLP